MSPVACPPKTVLVTGSAGRIGQAVVAALVRRGHRVHGLDRHPSPHVHADFVADLCDGPTLTTAFKGVDTLIHLAATPDDVDDPVRDLFPANITGLYHVLEAARVAGVTRLVLASSGQVNWHQNLSGPWPIGADAPVTPRSWYAATKMFLESIGSSFAAEHGMRVILARLGWCPRTAGQVDEIAQSAFYQDLYLSPADAARFFTCAVEAPLSIPCATLYATSRPITQARFDLAPAQALIGYQSAEQWPEGTEVVLASRHAG